jgi:hypothetical protein
MDSSLFARAALVQALLVGALFGLLIALPLGDDFFEDYGWITGPVAWIACAAVAARILALPPALALFAAAAGGIAGAVVGLALDHTAGLIVAIAVFAASCAGYDAGSETADAGT